MRLLSDNCPAYDALAEPERRYARMLFFTLWPNGGGFSSYDEGLRVLREEEAVCDELATIVELGLATASHVTVPLEGELATYPLRVHARYQREEILAAADYASLDRKPTSLMQGVAFAPAANADLLMATLRKSEADYSPTTMYEDYLISHDQFHWQSQSSTSVDSPTGQRYLRQRDLGYTPLLFVRETKSLPSVLTAPYYFLGPCEYLSHQGSRPISIVWRLLHAVPARLFRAMARQNVS